MDMLVEKRGEVAVVTVRNDHLDANNADEFRRDLEPVLASHRYVVCDLGRLQFLDSAGLGALLSCLRRLGERGGDLKLCGITPPVRSVLQITRMHRIFDIFATADEAVRAFAA